MFYYHFKDKYDLVAWMFCTDAYGKDITYITSAAAGMNYSSKAVPGYRYQFPTNFLKIFSKSFYVTAHVTSPCYNGLINNKTNGKTGENRRRKAIGTVKCQPAAPNGGR